MAEILDNQEVTTETLNNIAIDLGATTFNGFPENKFGVDELNNITKTLVSKGITQGANRCKPYLSGSDLYINTGTIIFATGAKIRITSPQKVTAEAGTYIYALNDTSRNIAEITVSETKPTTGDFVMLAYLDADSTLTDMREWAQSNVLLSSNQSISETIVIPANSSSFTKTLTIEWTGWKKLIFPYNNLYKGVSLDAVVDVEENETVNLGKIYNNTDRSIACSINRSGESIKFTFSSPSNPYETSFKFTFI